ncbi:hypothetical protein M3603_08455 [Rummeliibacillus stabekisii]|uniref:hypothetical protein n=1 Tax=Rummeliibacillus stabekisii TaxID=241244 RepID=UPI00204069AA|nr:hypothetical protein [Rummeliibacillus stabekisii]MCM3316708.1 hypothetical protein [Rummeliibacillus stabekisii]
MVEEVLKSTDYCDLLKQAKIEDGNSIYAIEKILVKEKGTKEIRFSYYKKDADGKEFFVPRPLDLEEEKLISLLSEGIKEEVISKDLLIKALSESLPR